MRTLITILICLPLFTFAQDSSIVFSKVVEIPGMDKSKLYDNARLWTISTLTGAKVLEDKENGLLAFEASAETIAQRPPKKNGKEYIPERLIFELKVKIQTKDNRYRYEVSQIYNNLIYNGKYPLMSSTPTHPADIADWVFVKINAEKYVDELMGTLTQYILKNKDNW
jgi:Domain of unknown function (DUF4468) with TBP-like fold